jgi:hypothetical protein
MHNVKWQEVLTNIASDISIELKLDIVIEEYILIEIQDRVEATS